VKQSLIIPQSRSLNQQYQFIRVKQAGFALKKIGIINIKKQLKLHINTLLCKSKSKKKKIR